MTIDKRETINVPTWLVAVFAPIIIAGIVSYGVSQSAKGATDTKIIRAEQDIETLRKEKVSKDEMTLILDRLKSIEGKLDEMHKTK